MEEKKKTSTKKKIIIIVSIIIILSIICAIVVKQISNNIFTNNLTNNLDKEIDALTKNYLGSNKDDTVLEEEKAIQFANKYLTITNFSFKKDYNIYDEEAIFFDIPTIKNNSPIPIKGIIAIITFYDYNNEAMTQARLLLLDKVNDLPIQSNMIGENRIRILDNIASVNRINIDKYDLKISQIFL